jgi:hypothetical protein
VTIFLHSKMFHTHRNRTNQENQETELSRVLTISIIRTRLKRQYLKKIERDIMPNTHITRASSYNSSRSKPDPKDKTQ